MSVVLGLIIIIALVFFVGSMILNGNYNKGYNQCQVDVLSTIVSSLQSKGYIQLDIPNGESVETITLVPYTNGQ